MPNKMENTTMSDIVQVTPAVSVGSMVFLGVSLNDCALILTAIYTLRMVLKTLPASTKSIRILFTKDKKMTDTLTRSFRLKVELIEKLEKFAKEENRTLNNYVETVLLNHIKTREQSNK